MSYRQRTQATWRAFKILVTAKWIAIAATVGLVLAHSGAAIGTAIAAWILSQLARSVRASCSRYYRLAGDARSAGLMFPHMSEQERERVARELRRRRHYED